MIQINKYAFNLNFTGETRHYRAFSWSDFESLPISGIALAENRHADLSFFASSIAKAQPGQHGLASERTLRVAFTKPRLP